MNLAGSPPGQNYTAIATASAVNPNAGTLYRLEWGNGTGTPLWIGNGIVGIGNSANAQTQLSTEALQPRAVVFPNEAGRVCLASDLSSVLTMDLVQSSSTPTTVPSISPLTLPIGKWAVFLSAICRSAATTCAVLPSLLVTNGSQLGGTFTQDPGAAPIANTDFGLTGIILVQITTAPGTVTLRVATEVNNTQITLRAGTTLMAMRIA
jgi:hypothetical protein